MHLQRDVLTLQNKMKGASMPISFAFKSKRFVLRMLRKILRQHLNIAGSFISNNLLSITNIKPVLFELSLHL